MFQLLFRIGVDYFTLFVFRLFFSLPKKYSQAVSLFVLLGSARVKAACRKCMKLTSIVNFTNNLRTAFFVHVILSKNYKHKPKAQKSCTKVHKKLIIVEIDTYNRLLLFEGIMQSGDSGHLTVFCEKSLHFEEYCKYAK